MGTTNKDGRTVRIEHPDGRKHTVAPDVARALAATDGFEIVGGRGAAAARQGDDTRAAVDKATAPLKERIADLEAQLAATSAASPTPPDEGTNPADPAKEA